MLVFTEEWRQELTNRYQSLKQLERPTVYCIAMEDKFRPMRECIETWVADQPALSREKLIKHFQSPKEKDRFLHTYHELAVGNLLRASGLETEYEKVINGKTPDWYVSIKNMAQHFIVDVFTKNIPDVKVRWDAWVKDLNANLRLIPLNICIELSHTQHANPPGFENNKLIASRIKTWLEQERPDIGDRLQLEDFIFAVTEKDSPFRWVWLEGYNEFSFVSPMPLKQKILEKIELYKDLITSNYLPLVNAVEPGSKTLYETEELENSIYGREKNEGLFADKPLLSGVIWANQAKHCEWQMKPYLNPRAQYPLPEGIFR